MKNIMKKTDTSNCLPFTTPYQSLSLINLIEKIAYNSSRPALEEFITGRKPFMGNSGSPLQLVQYLNELTAALTNRKWVWSSSIEMSEKTYDLTLDKFTNLPGQSEPTDLIEKTNSGKLKQRGSDCRLYYKAFLKRIEKSFQAMPPEGALEEEAMAAQMLQGLVRRHFYLSALEAERKANPMWSRYYWKINNQTICVWLPVDLSGGKRREWLEKNINDANTRRPRKGHRIQAQINRKLAGIRVIPFNDALHTNVDNEISPCSGWEEAFGKSLAEVVAEEKVETIDQQRRSIKLLGKKKLKRLILRIYEDIGYSEYHDNQIAKAYGLSKATFSRFAGSRWNKSGTNIPDLWLNTAQVLSTHTDFRQAVRDMGVWGQIKETLKRVKDKTKKGFPDE